MHLFLLAPSPLVEFILLSDRLGNNSVPLDFSAAVFVEKLGGHRKGRKILDQFPFQSALLCGKPRCFPARTIFAHGPLHICHRWRSIRSGRRWTDLEGDLSLLPTSSGPPAAVNFDGNSCNYFRSTAQTAPRSSLIFTVWTLTSSIHFRPMPSSTHQTQSGTR